MKRQSAYGIKLSSDELIKRLIKDRELKQHISQVLEQIVDLPTESTTSKD